MSIDAVTGEEAFVPFNQAKVKTEGDVKDAVKKILTKHGWFWWMPPANGMGKPNVDFNALRDGVFMAIETKCIKTKGALTAMQERFLVAVAAQSSFAFVVDEARVDALALFLRAFDRARYAKHREEEVSHEDGATMLNTQRAMMVELVDAVNKANEGFDGEDGG